MKRLSPETKKEIMHFFLATATKRILDERKDLNKKSISTDKSENQHYERIKNII
jgi:hypothetical protein